jgi:hypothetical protein
MSALVLSSSAATDQSKLAVQHRYALADAALKACGLVRPGCEMVQDHSKEFSVDSERITQMGDIVRKRGVKKRLEDDFDLKIGVGEDIPENESEEDFLARAIVKLRESDTSHIIKLFDRVEKNNRKAAATDSAFQAKQHFYRKKGVSDEATERSEDNEFGTWHKGSAESFADEFEDWYAKLSAEKDFSAWCGGGVFRGAASDAAQVHEVFPGVDCLKVQRALHYFSCNKPMVEEAPADGAPQILGASEIKKQLEKWSSASVLSAYRKLSRVKHPDKEGGSTETFQELTDNAKILMEACVMLHGTAKRHGKKNAEASAGASGAKVAICAELPESLRAAVEAFGFSEEDFRSGSPAEIKKVRLRLSAEKERKEKQIQREKETRNLVEILKRASVSEEEEHEAFEEKTLKELKALCTAGVKKQYTSLYGHLQKLK